VIDEVVVQRGCTTIIVTNNILTIQDADLILVMKNGCIVEKGCHDELMALKGEYYQLIPEEKRNKKTSLDFFFSSSK